MNKSSSHTITGPNVIEATPVTSRHRELRDHAEFVHRGDKGGRLTTGKKRLNHENAPVIWQADLFYSNDPTYRDLSHR